MVGSSERLGTFNGAGKREGGRRVGSMTWFASSDWFKAQELTELNDFARVFDAKSRHWRFCEGAGYFPSLQISAIRAS